jgi:PIN domain nuclease of toxin-antitoxin system
MPESEIKETFELKRLEIIPFSPEQAYQYGFLVHSTRTCGLSLGDRACLSLAKELQRIVLIADRTWKSIWESR